MSPLLSEANFNSVALIIIAAIGVVPAVLAAYWSKGAKRNSVEANANATEAKEHAAGALHEVKANGGMSDPDPTLKDYIKYVGEMVERDSRRTDRLESLFEEHLKHSKVMDAALAEVYFAIKPTMKDLDMDPNGNGEQDFT